MIPKQERYSVKQLSLGEITELEGEQGLKNAFLAELANTGWSEQDLADIHKATEIALDAHKNDTRGDQTYSTHILRVALRVMDEDHFNIRDQPDLITAAALHDIVEDHPDYLVDQTADLTNKANLQAQAVERIQAQFGDNVAEMVASVTNPIAPDNSTRSEKHRLYQEHTVELLESNTKAGILKVSDFVDNCAGIIHNENPEKAERLSRKYAPLIPYFNDFIARCPDFNDDVKEHLFAQLDRAQDRCNRLIDSVAA